MGYLQKKEYGLDNIHSAFPVNLVLRILNFYVDDNHFFRRDVK